MDFEGTQPDPYTPGGTNPGVPPVPSVPGNPLVPMVNDDGYIFFIEFDDIDVPLGEWHWDDDDFWFFDDWDVPLGAWEPPPSDLDMPTTGQTSFIHIVFLLGLLLIISGSALMIFNKVLKKKEPPHGNKISGGV